MLNSDCGCVKCVFDSASLPRYEDCDFLYFEPASVSKITEGMKTNFDSRRTGRKKREGKKNLRCVEIMRSLDLMMLFGKMWDDRDRCTTHILTRTHKHTLTHTHDNVTFNYNFRKVNTHTHYLNA